jgi:hypothetical protein
MAQTQTALLALLLASPLLTPPQVARTIFIKDLTVKDLTVREGLVSGVVVNASPARIRGVQLLLRQAWLWNDKRHPGTDSPGRTLPVTLHTEVAPNGSAPFTFQTPPLARRFDGRFVTTMDVTGFTEGAP